MQAETIDVLLVEDNPGDADLVRDLLSDVEAFPCRCEHVSRLDEAVRRLRNQSFHAVLLDLSLPDAHGLDTVTTALEAAGIVPVVVLSSLYDESLALRAVQHGAQDYLVKDNVDGNSLERAIRYAMERKQLADALVQKNAALERSFAKLKEIDARKDEFVSFLSHELRTPITVMLLTISRMLSHKPGPLTDDQTKCLEMVQRNANRLAGLINDILDISQIEAGQLRLNLADVSVAAIIQEVVASLALSAEENRCAIATDISNANLVARCDRDKIMQVLINLISNALKHNPAGTVIKISATQTTGRIRISVEDNGSGIPPHEQTQIFERYYQVHRERSSRARGTGLGLPIAKALVEAHGGAMMLSSEVAKGTSFTFYLPAVDIASPAHAPCFSI
jgi:signal transduction histidine kinase